MKWPDTCKLIERIKTERPELIVDWLALGSPAEHFCVRVSCIVKCPPDADGTTRRVVPGSIATIYGPDGWARYKEAHPEPWMGWSSWRPHEWQR